MKQYTWSANEEENNWENAQFDTIEECIEDALQVGDIEKSGTIFIGECVPFEVEVDADRVLENLIANAYDFADEYSDTWSGDISSDRKAIYELENSLTAVVKEWLKKHGNEPSFYQVEKINVPHICPYRLHGNAKNSDCNKSSNCIACWNRPLESEDSRCNT